MRHIHTLIIGAGQAGLAMSRCLSGHAISHVVLERGEIANSWRTERWDSLKLLTPNWQSRLPGHSYSGDDPDGFMDMDEVAGFLDTYAQESSAPIETRTQVVSVSSDGAGYRVATDRGEWICKNLILATGACNLASIPACAGALPAGIDQLTPLDYRNPRQLRPGGVLVVGASATGVQLASEIRNAGHDVVLAAGEHIRVPRHYRGRDIQWWMDRTGIHAMTIDEVDDIDRARRLPSLQLVGSHDRQFMDLNTLQAQGIELVGRLAAIRDGTALFSGSLANHCALSDLKMNRLLKQIDDWIGAEGLPAERFGRTISPQHPRLSLSLRDGRIRTVIWATGYRPDYSWLELPVFDRKGRLMHQQGRIAPGLYVLGLPFMRRRNSALIDGVGADAQHICQSLIHESRRAA